MTTPPDARSDALGPVRAALLQAAHSDAEMLLAQARQAVASTLDDARAQAEAIVDEARRQGEADGEAATAQALIHARRTARARELAARGTAYAQLRRRATERVRQLRDGEEYPALRERLAALASELLGPGACVTEHPDGGVVATYPGRRVDLSLDALAARALDRLGADTEALWEP
jgi:vacuolar-type H+-ATPase subunit E/Vma4